MTTRRIVNTDIGPLLSTCLYGIVNDFAHEFDMPCLEAEWLAMVNDAARQIAPSIIIHACGEVTCEIADLVAAAEINWRWMLTELDTADLLIRHHRASAEPPDGSWNLTTYQE